jgi:DNA-binding TFAR19-related protein (PDSD5 family)
MGAIDEESLKTILKQVKKITKNKAEKNSPSGH